eukprot:CAMPEP_0206477684 /NCGR_PEP_ID=MMETSP0324_2-20121206/35566_1 /ASSEMBLY_ACC=CAM_ASM_000836 /TAXON_ID=2866 /ORGANISM="Crypthecodinium cohnii, Strain Seligo" /LENGTH=45 /DNA_ID= /DNA_START= /DNA_END= /DNA_ORIENTATION=
MPKMVPIDRRWRGRQLGRPTPQGCACECKERHEEEVGEDQEYKGK